MQYRLVITATSRPGMFRTLVDATLQTIEGNKAEIQTQFPNLEVRLFKRLSGSGNDLILTAESDSLDELDRYNETGLKGIREALRAVDDSVELGKDVFSERGIDRQLLRSLL